jgi:hypothetical protein
MLSPGTLVFHILFHTYILCKFLRQLISIVSSGLYAGGDRTYALALGTEMS